MCHEIAGHGVFQGEWLRRHYRHRFSKARLVTTEEVPSPKSLSILERQANLFAAHAAAPQWFVEREILRTFAPKMPFRFIKPGVQGFDLRGQYVERRIDSYSHLCRTLAKFIQHRFGGLSVESLGYRIQESGYVLDLSQRKLVLRRVA
jgi:hypothetical protein